jgi:hypothetical protein
MARDPRNETIAIERSAGASVVSDRHELRPLGQDTLIVIGADGRTPGTVAFLDRREDGRFRLLATGRVAERTT